MTPMIEAHGLTKRYGKTRALDGLDVARRERPGGRGARPQWRRQDDVRAHGGDAAPADTGMLQVAGHDVAGIRPRSVA